GKQTLPTSAGDGSSDVAALAGISGLQPGRTYHYRLVAINADGTAHGGDRTFTTQKPPFAGLVLPPQNVKVDAKEVARVAASCPAKTVGACRGTLTLTTKDTILGSGRLSIAAGAHRSVAVKLS